jgi:hypothetical protein
MLKAIALASVQRSGKKRNLDNLPALNTIEAPDELILKLLPSLDKKQLAHVA